MKAKLIKVDDVYRLVEVTKHGNSIIGTTDLDYQKSWSDRCQKLSLKNCQAIERGYDLNELGMDYASTIYDGRTELTRFNGAKVDFIKGFQKALELMGDKKFDEEDILIAIEAGYHAGINHNVDEEESGDKIIRLKDSVIPSLQQTEWDVKVEMGGYRLNDDGEIIGFPSYELPKLDADGCLILKRI